MSQKYSYPQEAKIHGALKPAADAAGRAGRWVSVKYAHKVFIKVYVDQGNAATIALTVQQAQDVAGTGNKAITGNLRIWVNDDLSTSDTLVRAADATSYTTTANVKEKLVILELDPSTLDVANGFAYIRVSTGASNVANITSAIYVETPLRIPADVPPTIIT